MTPTEKLHFFWKHLKVRMNNPNQIVYQEDILSNLLQRKEDLSLIMNSLGILTYNSKITFGEVLTKIGIKL
jgi:hypothetical protein|nr:MAG TPA: hypothetical protein [Caudoviricetes sp.]